MEQSLTFGIELEFMCVFKKDAFTNIDEFPDLVPDCPQLIPVGQNVDEAVEEAVEKAVEEAIEEAEGFEEGFEEDDMEDDMEDEQEGEQGVDETGEDEYVQPPHALCYLFKKAGLRASGWNDHKEPPVAPFSTWKVHSDILFLTPGEQAHVGDHLEWEFEISSPVLSLTDPESFSQIRKVHEVLAFMEGRFGCTFLTNYSTGFHVHMGCGARETIPLPVAKRIFQLTTAHERNFDALHALSRIPVVQPGDDVPQYAPLSYIHQALDLASDENAFDWLRRIEETRSYANVGGLFQVNLGSECLDGHSSTLNFDNLHYDEAHGGSIEDVPGTIEFRQHLGTLDIVEIIKWVLILGHVVTYCYQASD